MEMLGWLTNSFSSAVASNKKIKKIYQEMRKEFSNLKLLSGKGFDCPHPGQIFFRHRIQNRILLAAVWEGVPSSISKNLLLTGLVPKFRHKCAGTCLYIFSR